MRGEVVYVWMKHMHVMSVHIGQYYITRTQTTNSD